MSIADEEDLLLSLRSQLTQAAGDLVGLSEAQSTELGNLITRFLQKRYGGREVYIRARSRKDLDREITTAFTGDNRDEICQRYGISKATFYRILDRTR